jgi:ferredoxin--NADP+ reductase
MRLKDFDTSTRYVARVVSNDCVVDAQPHREVHEIVLEVDDAFRALPGQNIGLIIPAEVTGTGEPHFRLYSISDLPDRTDGKQRVHIYVRRCNYFDALTGQTHHGVASNFLCDCRAGVELQLAGPYGQAFEIPRNHHANLILIGAGTGIAPFRAFLKHVYRHHPEFAGKVYLFYGGETGLDLLYGNDRREDVSMYYDRHTFEAVEALSTGDDSEQYRWSDALMSRGKQLAQLLCDPNTYVYIAGLENIRDELEDVLREVAGSNQRWEKWKQQLVRDGRWIELLY